MNSITMNPAPSLAADVVEHADIRVFQRGHGAGLALEPGAQIFTLGDVFRQDLDGDSTVEPRVAGLIDLSHATHA